MEKTAGSARSVSRDELYGFVYLLLTINALPTFVGESVQSHGWLNAVINLFDISAIVWLAIAAGMTLLWKQAGPDLTARPNLPLQRDWAVAAIAVLAALAPLPPLSAAALSVAALWGWLTTAPHTPGRRAAAIFLSLSTFLFWGRIFLALGAGPLLSADAAFVSMISGMPAFGNVLQFADGTRFLIAPGCSSLHGISLALILWTTVVAWFDYSITARLRWTLVLALLASILVNGVRLTMIAWYPKDFDYWHVGLGATCFGWMSLIVITGIVYRGTLDQPRADG